MYYISSFPFDLQSPDLRCHIQNSTGNIGFDLFFRIINVSSCAQVLANLDLHDLMGKSQSLEYAPRSICQKLELDLLDYANSKLAISYFTKQLAKRLRGTNLTVYSVCPGLVVTKLIRSVGGLGRLIGALGFLLIGQTAENVMLCIEL